MKKINFVLIILLIIAIIFVLKIPKKEKKFSVLEREAPLPQPPQELTTPSPPPIIPQESSEPEKKSEMKVEFYTLDQEKREKGEFLGTAELKDGRLITNVSDPKLKEMLENPYPPTSGETTDETVIYQPGTIEHLRAIVLDCWQFGYLGEIKE